MNRWIEQFLEAQAAERYASVNTLAAYRRDLEDFEAFCVNSGVNFEAVERDTVEDYLIHCDQQGFSRSTRARRLSSVKGLFGFAYQEGFRDTNPAIQIKGPARAKSLPKTLSHEAVDRLLAESGNFGRNDSEKLRNRTMLELLYATGLRVSELVTLPAATVRGDPQMILVKGKGE